MHSFKKKVFFSTTNEVLLSLHLRHFYIGNIAYGIFTRTKNNTQLKMLNFIYPKNMRYMIK